MWINRYIAWQFKHNVIRLLCSTVVHNNYFLFHNEHMADTVLPTLDFIAGIVETSGSFFFTKSGSYTLPVFQVKLVGREKHIIELIIKKLGLTEVVHEYLHGGRHYAVLTVRRRSTIERVIIPTFDNRLLGVKKTQFNTWRDQFYKQQLAKLPIVSQETQ